MSMAYPLAELPFAAGALLLGGLCLLYLLYQWALPKPLPGIPYNKQAAKSILGDASELMRIRKNGGRPRIWFTEQNTRLNSPIVQAFVTPFSKPLLILSDFREVQDILLRRGKEFDRGGQNLDALGGVIPYHQISMQTTDPQFKANRELVKDLMTPNFLNTVSAPEIWSNAAKFIDLWRLKAQKANGRPFRADEDISVMAFDVIKVVALGEGDSESMTELYHQTVEKFHSDSQHPDDKNAAFAFPENPPSEDLLSHQLQQEAIGHSIATPSPAMFHRINNRKPAMRRAFAIKKKMLEKQIGLALRRQEEGKEVKSALDYMIRREINAAAKAERKPRFDSPYMHDELYGYIGAGHETTSTSFQWAIKHLAIHRDAQAELRKALRAAYPEAAAERRQPTVAEMTKIRVPYLEAVMEEALRLTSPVTAIVRQAQADTTVLGHHVPRGTQVCLNLMGPSITEPGFAIDERLRSESARCHKETRGAWSDDPRKFVPERWLKLDGGALAFDAQAGPFLTFSSGVRGCFGRRLAYLQLRFLMALLLWNFELGPLPEELNTFDATDSLTTKPVQCFVRISEVKP